MVGLTWMNAQSAVGLLAFTAFAWIISENRRGASIRVALAGLALQLGLAGLLLFLPGSHTIFEAINSGVLALSAATKAGTSFVYGYLGGGPLPFDEKFPGGSFILAFQALPLILVVSALTALLTYWRPPTQHGRRRCCRIGNRREHICRDGRSASIYQALFGEAQPIGIVRAVDRRHGNHRWHSAGALWLYTE